MLVQTPIAIAVFAAAAALGPWGLAQAGTAAKQAAASPAVERPINDFDALGPFQIEPALKLRVKFWIDVYSKYSKWDMVLHDAKYPHIVFDVVPTRTLHDNVKLPPARRQSEIHRKIESRKQAILALLRRLHEKRFEIERGAYPLTGEEKRIYQAYAGVTEKDKFLAAATGVRRVRGQFGLKESFLEGLYESGRYLPGMKQIAVKLGVPPEIVYLPFLESGFDRRALSKVGASGLWQFMPGTGKFFLRVDDAVDERNDPMKAAEGAALLMRDNFAALEAWPLAITAYNHGRAGMQRAVRVMKSTSLAKIIDDYDGPNFGFASANFFSAFIAAVHVAQNAGHYFGDVDRAEPLVFEEFVMPEYMDVGVLAKNVGIDIDVLREYNPALTSAVWSHRRLIPVGYTLRIPYERREDFLLRYKAIAPELRLSKQIESDGPALARGSAAPAEHSPPPSAASTTEEPAQAEGAAKENEL